MVTSQHAVGGGNNITGDQSLAVGHYNFNHLARTQWLSVTTQGVKNDTTVALVQQMALNASAVFEWQTATGALAVGTGANAQQRQARRLVTTAMRQLKVQ